MDGQSEDGSTNRARFGSRVVLQVDSASGLDALTNGHPLSLSRVVASNLFILQAPDALTAAREAQRLASTSGVKASYPVMRQSASLDGAYAPQPSDANFAFQWSLEHRNGDGSPGGVDLNIRAAWPYSTGQGVTVAVADNGVELTHPELAAAVLGQPHYNFLFQSTNAGPVDRQVDGAHGTGVAGLIASDLGHARIVGVAPGANLASWVVVDTNTLLGSDEQLMDMYQFESNRIGVENFSWGHGGPGQVALSPLEEIGISNAIHFG
ncbi:MAG: S8 family serine peptidase, partial [Limisphaerales bacterium]